MNYQVNIVGDKTVMQIFEMDESFRSYIYKECPLGFTITNPPSDGCFFGNRIHIPSSFPSHMDICDKKDLNEDQIHTHIKNAVKFWRESQTKSFVRIGQWVR